MKTLIIVALLAAFTTSSSAAGNFSGRWAISNTAGRGGQGGPMILVLNHVGSEVTGTIGARSDVGSGSPANGEILGGKVQGDVVSFYVWTGRDQPTKTTYQGKMSDSGDEIQFTVSGEPGGRGPTGGPQQVVAKRTK